MRVATRYREDSFGHATLTIDASGNNATWVWHRADDDSATDTVEFVRDIAACPNRGTRLSGYRYTTLHNVHSRMWLATSATFGSVCCVNHM